MMSQLNKQLQLHIKTNISRSESNQAMRFGQLKAHRQISKKWCFEKYCSCDQVCQVSAL